MNKTRNIFEDVNTDKPRDTPIKGGFIDEGRDEWRVGVSQWMKTLFIFVCLMVVVGGLTRLTDSGLSITEWNVVKGALPPLSEAAWALEFDKYKNIPEYQLQNKGMSLGDFKVIYWWEWGHRQLGRLLGIIWFVGFLYLNIKYRIPNSWKFRMLIVGLFGGMQGAIGLWMVSSGLVCRMVDVASYRLATHLGLAFIILGTLFWFKMRVERTDVDLMQSRRRRVPNSINWTSILLVFAFAQILIGALVAGIDAGTGYIDWPMMNGEFLPSESFDYLPFWINFFENPALVQFNHRILGYILMLLGIIAWIKSRNIAHRKLRIGFKAILIMMIIQMVLGILTVMYAAPWYIAIFHQIGAIFLLVLILQTKFIANFHQEQSVRS